MKNTSPPHEQKLEFHKLRAEGKFPGGTEGWKLYLEWRSRRSHPPRNTATDPAPCVDEEPPPTPQEELGF